jgi:hypothetical protein
LEIVSVDYLITLAHRSDFSVWMSEMKVPSDEQCHSSSKMAATVAMLEFVFVGYLTNALANRSDFSVAYWE